MQQPFRVQVSDAALADLRERLSRVRFPAQLPDAGWDYGTELDYLRELVTYWRDDYDWPAQEKRLNAFSQFCTTIDGQRIHFIHARSPDPDALPLLVVHGWPGSVAEYLDVIGPLNDPSGNGGLAADAFHVVAPSLPGFAFSGPTTEPGWHPRRISDAFAQLMADLGYERYGTQGGDWGAAVTRWLAIDHPPHVAGAHFTQFGVQPPPGSSPHEYTTEQQAALDAVAQFVAEESGYHLLQSTRPQTVGYALDDSPVGLLAWIVEKMRSWSDCGGDIESAFTRDQILTNVMCYWVTATAHSSARLYFENRRALADYPLGVRVVVPTGVSSFPGDTYQCPREWLEHQCNLVHYSRPPRGGHFAAMEEPELFVDEVRTFFRLVR
jgi:microsomal epoxide hydrolase